MDSSQFREFGKAAVDWIADYMDTVEDRHVLSSVKPGYLNQVLPEETPNSGERWQRILQDLDKVIMPGLTHWHSPYFHAYYPTANSFPGIVGELMSSSLGSISTDLLPNPVFDNLELKMMDWLAKIIGLPEQFLNSSEGAGGGVIQNAASESTLIALLAAKNRSKRQAETVLVVYTSAQSNSSVEKAGLLASVITRLLTTDQEDCLRGNVLLQAILEDLEAGLTPCCVVATLGTTGTCAFDKLDEIGPICQRFKLWLHVDAAYAGSAFACPEYRYLMNGIEFVDSFNINPHKWMLVNSDCSATWFKSSKDVGEIFNHKPGNKYQKIQYWHQISDTRRFRSLKLWFVLRIYGVEGIQKHIRHQIRLAEYLSTLVQNDEKFEVCVVSMGLVCFRLKGEDQLTQHLIDRVTARKNVFIMPYYYQSKLVIRLVICSRFTEETDVLSTWKEIRRGVNSKDK